MLKKISRVYLPIFVLILCFLFILTACEKNKKLEKNEDISNNLEVHFIDVGQADSILIKNGEKSMLIDAGNNGDANLVVNYLRSQGVEKLDYVVGTHPHEDHIGGLDAVIDTFDIEKVYMPKVTHTSKTFKDVITSIKNKGLKISNPVVGSKFMLGDAKGVILAPNSSKYEGYNNYSIVIKLTYGNNSFLFTGDAEELSEKEMLHKNFDLSADVLKIGHHGSHSSTSLAFLDKVNPKYGVIMTEIGNDYGHPHKETMDKLKNKNITVYRTDENGTIVMTSDGENIKFDKEPGDYSYGKESKSTEKEKNSIIQIVKAEKAPKEEKVYVDENGKGLIKGNINSKGEKIYHMPNGAYYKSVKAEMMFKTQEEAKAAGFRKSKK